MKFRDSADANAVAQTDSLVGRNAATQREMGEIGELMPFAHCLIISVVKS